MEKKNIADVQPSELALLVNFCDKGNHGILVLERFDKLLHEIAQESDNEKLMKKFSRDVSSLPSSLANVLAIKDTNRTGNLAYPQFKRALTGSGITLTEGELKSLFEEGFAGSRDELNIKHFTKKVEAAFRTKNLVWDFRPPKASAKAPIKGTTEIVQEAADPKLKKSIDALKTELEEKNREIKSLNQAIEDSNKRVLSLENQIKKLESKLVDKHAKPPQAMREESLTQGGLDQVQQLRDEIFHMQNANQALNKIIQVDLKTEMSRVVLEKEEMEEKYRAVRDQLNSKKAELLRLVGDGSDDAVARGRKPKAEDIYAKRIEELERELDARDEKQKRLQDDLFTQQEKVLDLKFEKETFDLQYARLQKRITDLEQYKLQSSQLSAVIKSKYEQELEVIKD